VKLTFRTATCGRRCRARSPSSSSRKVDMARRCLASGNSRVPISLSLIRTTTRAFASVWTMHSTSCHGGHARPRGEGSRESARPSRRSRNQLSAVADSCARRYVVLASCAGKDASAHRNSAQFAFVATCSCLLAEPRGGFSAETATAIRRHWDVEAFWILGRRKLLITIMKAT